MDRVLCICLCLLVIIVSVFVLNYFGEVNASPEEKADATVESTEPILEETEPPIVETTAATEPTETVPPTTETEPVKTIYDVPLSKDLQSHIISLCEVHDIDPAIVMAIIWKESRFNTWSGGDGGESLGLMQIQPKWHSGLMASLGCTDLHDPFQNVTVGIQIFASHMDRYDGDVGMALTSYNAGATGAYNYYFSKGIYASKYAVAVMAYADDIR